MKRCSQCHFTFEDYEDVCDFDGTILSPYPNPAPLSDRIAPRRSSLNRLARSPVSLIGVALALQLASALLLVRYESASEPRQLEAAVSRIARPEPIEKRKSEGVARNRVASTNRRVQSRKSGPTKAALSTARRTSVTARSQPQVARKRTAVATVPSAHPKEESRVTAALKKTANILKRTVSTLKKPFDF